MFGRKQKIEVTVEGRNSARAGVRPVAQRIISDIVSPRSGDPASRAVKGSAIRPAVRAVAETVAPIVAKITVADHHRSASVTLGKKLGAAMDAVWAKTITAKAKPSGAPQADTAHPPHAGKLDFLTRRPIAESKLPKLPKKSGVSASFQEKLNDLSALLGSASRSKDDDGLVMVGAAPRRVSTKVLIVGFSASLILIFGGGFFALNIFSSVTVNIVPKFEDITIDKTFSVAKDSNIASGVIAGELMTFRQAVEASKETTGKLDANSKARGRIVIYNAYSAESQTLVRRTRFETPEGKIYRLLDGTTVPGFTTKSGQTTPGSIEVAVEADQPGEEYNVGLSDFTIPGFKSTARYTKFYGRSKTLMVGGATSEKRVTARADIDELKTGLAAKLEETIKSEYGSKVPEGFKLLDGAYTIGYEDAAASPPLDAEGENVTVALVGNFRGLLIKKELLAEAIATVYGKDGLSKKARVVNVDDLTISVVRQNLESNEMSIHVSGRAHFVWNIDQVAIVSEFMAGKSTAEIFGAHEGIEKAEIVFSPSWWHYIPKNKDKIHIKLIGA